MIESRYASSPGIGRSSAIFSPSFGLLVLIKAVVKRAMGSRRTASNAGRKSGSNRRSRCTKTVEVSLSQFKNAEPVLAFGAGRLILDSVTFKAQTVSRVFQAEAMRPTMVAPENFVNGREFGRARGFAL